MHIKDISSKARASRAEDAASDAASSSAITTNERVTPLLRKLDLPIEHLDYEYVKNCDNVREIEKILRILRSGEEGRYEDLERFVENRLQKLQPGHRLLRTEVPILTRSALERTEMESIDSDLRDWLQEVELEQSDKSIEGDDSGAGEEVVPVRGTQVVTSTDEASGPDVTDGFIKHRHPDHIKSWEYDKWAKFNVDAELTKLEIEEMRAEEERQIENAKREAAKCDPAANVNSPSTSHKAESTPTPVTAVELGPSYIEEIPDTKAISVSRAQPQPREKLPDAPKQISDSKTQRRFKIVIDDLNIS